MRISEPADTDAGHEPSRGQEGDGQEGDATDDEPKGTCDDDSDEDTDTDDGPADDEGGRLRQQRGG